MPRLEPKDIQRELEAGTIWPVYWLYGHERMKSRELLKRIRKAVLSPEGSAGPGLGFAEERLDANETNGHAILDSAQSIPLGGGARFIVVRDAHELKDAEAISGLFGPKLKREDVTHVCVFISKDLDQRKKLSKLLLEKAAVVPCEEVPSADRENWVAYLAKQRGLLLDPERALRIAALDPWTLDIVDQELEKLPLARENGAEAALLDSTSEAPAESFIDALLSRDLKAAAMAIPVLASQPDEALPLLGLLSWNVRQLSVHLAAPNRAQVRMNPYLAEKMRRWAPLWSLDETLSLQEALLDLDFCSKQTQHEPLGLWTELALRFCRASV